MMELLGSELEHKLRTKYPGILRSIADCEDSAMDVQLLAACRWSSEAGIPESDALDLAMTAWFVNLWRKNRIVYHIDDALGNELGSYARRMADSDSLPGDLLRNLPYPCISIEGPPICIGWRESEDDPGVSIDYTGRMLVTCQTQSVLTNFNDCLLVHAERVGGRLVTFTLPILGTLGESLEAVKADVSKEFPQANAALVRFEACLAMYAAQFVLYLQAVNADIERKPASTVKKRKPGTPKPPKEYHVGYHVGQTLRRAYAYTATGTGTGSAKRPHTRRGHWHNYWIGSGEGRHLELRWVSPTMIHPDGMDELPTVRHVK